MSKAVGPTLAMALSVFPDAQPTDTAARLAQFDADRLEVASLWRFQREDANRRRLRREPPAPPRWDA
jgi:hypothetical protein